MLLGAVGKASRTWWMIAGCRSASTLRGNEPGSSPRITGAVGVSGMRITVPGGSVGFDLPLQARGEAEIAGAARDGDQAADHEVPHLGRPTGL